MEYIQCGIWGEKLLRQAESHDSFERISIFSPMGGKNVRETGKGSWTKSEDTRGEVERNGISIDCIRPFRSSMLCCEDAFKSIFSN